MKHIAIIILYVMTLNAQTIYVGSCGTPNQTTIQNAINTAISGDTVSICNGSYTESPIIDKNITITSFAQNSSSVTIDGANNSTATLRITNEAKVVLKYLTISNKNDYGLDVQSDVNYLSLQYIIIDTPKQNAINVKNIYGDLNLTNCTIDAPKGKGLFFDTSEYATNVNIKNTQINSADESLLFYQINGDFLLQNSTIDSKNNIALKFNSTILHSVKIINSTLAAYQSDTLYFSTDVNHSIEITSNDISTKKNSGAYALYIDSLNANLDVSSNIIDGGEVGFYIRDGIYNGQIKDNNFSSSATYGLKILNQLHPKNLNFLVLHNCFTKNDALNYDTTASFNNAYYGNYWGKCTDANNDNICDTPYTLTAYGTDYLPLADCGVLPTFVPAFKFDAYDTTRSLSDRNISTKIISQDFNLTIAETNSTDFNGTLCATVDKATWKKLLFSNSHESITSFNQAKAKKNAQIYMEWAYNKNLSCPLNLNDGNSTYSTDNFAIRPQSFSISSPNDKNASEVFSISFLANSAIDYNETINSSFSIDYNITKAGCNNGVLYIPNASFSDGNLTFDTNFSEIGELNITISEKNATSFALVDNDDTPDTQRIITKASKLINFTPYELNIIDFSYTNTNGKNWLYMDDLLEQNTTISFKVKAQNKAHESLINFDKNCYAKEVNISLSFTPDVNLSLLTELNTTKILNDTNFTNGTSEQVSYIYNIKREIGKPLNPMDINLSEINTTNPNIINLGLNLDKNSTKYYYGRVHSPDYKIYEPITVNAIYEVYCKSCSDKNSSWISSVDDYYWYKISNDIFATYTLTKTETKEIPSSKYLRYNIFAEDINNSFFVEFLSPNTTSWDGVGKHVDLNVSQRSNNRIEW